MQRLRVSYGSTQSCKCKRIHNFAFVATAIRRLSLREEGVDLQQAGVARFPRISQKLSFEFETGATKSAARWTGIWPGQEAHRAELRHEQALTAKESQPRHAEQIRSPGQKNELVWDSLPHHRGRVRAATHDFG